MSEKISMEQILPVALELYKSIPSVAGTLKPQSDEERIALLQTDAEQFATFCHHLQQKLMEEDE